MGIQHQFGFFDQAFFSGENNIAPFLKFAHREKSRNPFTSLEIEQIDDRFAARGPARLRQLVHFDPINLADGRKKQDVGVHRGDKQRLDEILVFGRRTHLAFAAAPLRAV